MFPGRLVRVPLQEKLTVLVNRWSEIRPNQPLELVDHCSLGFSELSGTDAATDVSSDLCASILLEIAQILKQYVSFPTRPALDSDLGSNSYTKTLDLDFNNFYSCQEHTHGFSSKCLQSPQKWKLSKNDYINLQPLK